MLLFDSNLLSQFEEKSDCGGYQLNQQLYERLIRQQTISSALTALNALICNALRTFSHPSFLKVRRQPQKVLL